jgi:hypothetical protein
MIKKLPNSNIISAVLVASSMALGVHNTAQAQSITLYRTGVIVPPTYSKISDAISAALSGDSLVLSPHTFKENNLVIGKDLKLTGTSDTSAVSIIDAELKNRAILINNGSVYIKDLVIQNGKITDGAGGGICNNGSKILSIGGRSKITNCSAVGVFANGGGIYSTGRLDLTGNAMVSNNSASEEGGGVYANSTFLMSGFAKVNNNKADGSGGGVFSKANGGASITGFSEIANNEAKVAGGGLFGVGTLENQASIKNNKANMGGGIASFNDVLFLRDTATISNNTANAGAGIWLNNCLLYGYSSFHITDNKIPSTATGSPNFGGAIYNVNGSLFITGGVIKGNQSPVAAVYNTAGATATIVRFASTHFFNPKSDGSRQAEIFNSPSLSSSVIDFDADYCWWGQNDTTKLIGHKAGTMSGVINSFVKLTWLLNNGLPIDPSATSFPLSADFRLNDGSKMDSLTLRHINGTFMANKGSFTPTNRYIDTVNYVRSVYTAPAASDSISIVAYVDADTFRAAKIAVKGLSIDNKNISSHIKIYPNPATQTIYIAEAILGSKIAVYTISGQLILSKDLNTQLESIDVSNWATGNYLLQITEANGHKMTSKIVKN